MKKNKIIVWTLIWGLTTIILIKADKLEKNYRILCEIINSGVFQYVTIDLIINQLHKDNSKKKYRNILHPKSWTQDWRCSFYE